jgi:hypothetical protein
VVPVVVEPDRLVVDRLLSSVPRILEVVVAVVMQMLALSVAAA